MEKISINILLLFLTINLYSATDDNNSIVRQKNIQVSLTKYIATDGYSSRNNQYHCSINLFSGEVGGVNGLEFGIINKVHRNINGLQIAFVTNEVLNMACGLQIAGLGNGTHHFNGLQIAGLGNSTRYFYGLQIAGLGNTTDNFYGLQIAGLGNTTDNFNGLQIAGLGNISNGSFPKVKIMNGLQIAGLGNSVDILNGLQITSLINIVSDLSGFQLGLVNYAYNVKIGGQIGLFNYVENGGYRAGEVSFSDYANTQISFKSGLQHFYNIISLQGDFINNESLAFGYGLGSIFDINSNFAFQPEIISSYYCPQKVNNNNIINSTELKLGIRYNFNSKLSLIFAPTIYALWQNSDQNLVKKFSNISPFYKHSWKNENITVGFNFNFSIEYH